MAKHVAVNRNEMPNRTTTTYGQLYLRTLVSEHGAGNEFANTVHKL